MRKFVEPISRMKRLREAIAPVGMSIAMAVLMAVALSIPGEANAGDTMLQARLRALGLPQLKTLTFESNYTVFMKANVPADIRRFALRKLWSCPIFNETDGLASYVDNYTTQVPVMETKVSAGSHREGIAH
jgi:hypothetical protein